MHGRRTASYKYCAGSLTAQGNALNPALDYLVTGDAAQCTKALAVLNDSIPSGVCDPVPSGNAYLRCAVRATDAHCNISRNGSSMLQIAAVRDWCDARALGHRQADPRDRMVTWVDWYLANYTRRAAATCSTTT